ncbi:MAG: hypothetical protein ACI8PZ_005503 [Myxococcota bacterium]|jgi:hypothetical protein
MGLRVVPLLLALGCVPNDPGVKGDTAAASTSTPPTSTGTTEPGSEPFLSGGCVQGEVATVSECAFEADRLVDLVIEWAAPHLDRPRILRRAEAAEHRFAVPLLTEQTAWTWTAWSELSPSVVLTGALTTGAAKASPFAMEVLGPPQVELVAFAGRCGLAGHLVVVDSATGRLAMSTPLGEAQPEGLRFGRDGGLVVLDAANLRDVGPDGVVRNTVPMAGLGAHHDAVAWQDGYAVLVQERIDLTVFEYRIDDSLVLLDDLGLELARVVFSDLFPPHPETARDWTHANSVGPAADPGDLLVSLRHQSAVFQVAADPDAPDFGALRWYINGDPDNPDSVRGSDLRVVDALGNPADFVRQHDPNLLADGRLTLFDNRHSPGPSRLVDLRLDFDAGEAVVERVWELDRHCDFQGGARELPGGGRLATCAPQRQVMAFAPEAPTAHVWALNAGCEADAGYITRALPGPW